MLTAALLLSTLASTAPQVANELHHLSVLVEDAHTGQLIEAAEIVTPLGTEAREYYIVLPEVHESELVPRLVPFNGEVEIYLWSASRSKLLNASLSYIDHDPLQQIVERDGKLLLLSDMRLPWSASYRTREPLTHAIKDLDLIPELARLDGARALVGDLPVGPDYPRIEVELLPPEQDAQASEYEHTWVALFGLRGPGQRHLDGCNQALSDSGWNMDYWSLGGCDQLIMASAAEVRPKHRVKCSEYEQIEFTPSTLMPGKAIAKSESLDQWAGSSKQTIRIRGDVPAPSVERLARTWIAIIRVQPAAAGKSLSATRRESMLHAESRDHFHDEARFADLGMVHMEGPRMQLDIRPTMGPGAAWGDVDGDGLVDLYLVQGGGREGSVVPRNRLYRNKGDGTFADITTSSNTGHQGAGMGALFCDLDSDGDLDLYVANYGRDVLYWNDGEGVFTPSEGQLPDLDLWSAGVAASDYDKDGDLDLYITSYLDYDESKMPPMDELERYQREDPVAMLPFAFPGQRNVFLRNDVKEDGSRHFSDVTEELGLLDVQGRGMQAIFWDFDQDGDDDLYVANDVSFNTLFRNEGDGTFRDVTFLVGLDDPRGGMGLSVGDVDRDGDEDLFLTNWQLEANALYQNNLINRAGRKLHTGTFADHTVQSRLGPAGIGVTSWGCELFDADNDGDLDLFVANGYTSPDYESTGICVGQPNHFFLNDGRGRFTEAFEQGGAALAERLPSRGAVACDYDQDGLLDLLVTANNSAVQLLKNRGKSLGHWINLRLAGSNGNTFAVGARVHARCGDDTFVASLRAGTGYLTGNAPELHLGLGAHAQIDELTIHWPSGRVTTHESVAVDRVLSIREPD